MQHFLLHLVLATPLEHNHAAKFVKYEIIKNPYCL